MKAITFLILAFLFSCNQAEDVYQKSSDPIAELPEASSYPLELDKSEYAMEFIANCQTCHTARYIEMQPAFSKKTWEKIVNKMIHKYGAPIDSAVAGRIVDYLVYAQDN